ncbi:MAG: translocation/assembly module TamB domain-containing protein [Deltaproteobacteria bacterium]|nr:translocation/assembly module TamB domain-containing protein [Deltaproteobacteria bacterium]
MPTSSKKTWPRARKALKIMAAALALAALLLEGLLLWLGTESGAAFVGSQVAKSLADEGLTVEWSRLDGPLPRRLVVEALTVADRQGVFLKIDRLEANLELSSLLRGLLEIKPARADGLQLTRRPNLPPQPSKTSQGFSLGLAIQAELTDGLMSPAVLDPALADLEPRALNLAADFFFASGRLRLTLIGGWTSPDGHGLTMTAALTPGRDGGPDELRVDLQAADGPGGPLSRLLDLPDWPAWRLLLQGRGPLSDWEGYAGLELEGLLAGPDRRPGRGADEEASDASSDAAQADSQDASRGASENAGPSFAYADGLVAEAQLKFHGATGRVETDLGPDADCRLELAVMVGPETPLPEAVAARLGQGLALHLQAALKERRLTGQLSLTAEKARLEAAELALEPLEAPGGWRLTSAGRLTLTGDWLDPLGGQQTSEDLARRASAEAGLAGLTGSAKESAASQAAGREDVAPAGQADGPDSGTAPALGPEQPPSLGSASATTPAPAASDSAAGSASGPAAASDSGSTLALASSADQPDQPVQPGLTTSPSQPAESASPAALRPAPPEAASADWRLEARGGPDAVELERLALEGDGLKLSLAGRLDADGRRLELKLSAAQDSAWLTATAASASLQGPLSLSADVAQSAEGLLEAAAEAFAGRLSDLAPGWDGELRTKLSARGPLERLAVELDADSPQLSYAEAVFRAAQANFSGIVGLEPQALAVDGRLTAQAEHDDAGALTLTAQAAVHAEAPGRLTLAVPALSLAGSGLSLELADVAASAAPGVRPDLSGRLQAALSDWRLPSELAARNISGGTLKAQAALERASDGRPSLTARLELPELSVDDELRLTGLQLDASALIPAPAAAPGPAAAADQAASQAVNQAADQAAASALDRFPDFALSLSCGPGRAGQISFARGSLEAAGQGADGRLKLSLDASQGAELAAVEGEWNLVARRGRLAVLRLAPPQLPDKLILTRPAELDWSAGPSLAEAVFAYGQARLSLSGRRQPLRAALKLADLPLSALAPLSPSIPQGRVNLEADYAEGRQGSFKLQAEIVPPPGLGRLPKTVGLTARGRLKDGRDAAGVVELDVGQGRAAALSWRLPMVPAGLGVKPDFGRPLEAELRWRGPAETLWSLAGLADRRLSGQLDLDLAVGGTLARPTPRLDLYLADGVYEDLSAGFFLRRINLELHGDAREEIKVLAEAYDQAQGRAALEGTLNLTASTISARAQLRRLAPLQRDDVSFAVSGLASVAGPLTGPTVKARAVIEGGELNLAGLRGGKSVKTLDVAEDATPPAAGPTLDVELELPRQFYVRGRGLDSEWQGHARLTGPALKPALSGVLKPVRGTFELLAKQFVFSGGEIRFSGGPRLDPLLNLELTRDTQELLALVRVGGSLSAPKISMESHPPRPSDEVLAQILFGKKASELSRVEALQLADNLRELAGLGGPSAAHALTAVRESLGLSVLRVGEGGGSRANERLLGDNSFRDNLDLDRQGTDAPDSGDAPTIEAGRYLTDNVYVGLEQNLNDNSTGVRVEVELTPSLNLQSNTSTSSSRVGLGWKKDY